MSCHPPQETCATCYFYSNGEPRDRGDCRYEPPSVNGSWPTVNAGQWCGAWSADGVPRWQGPRGPRGATWSEGEGNPNAPAEVGDLYLDSLTGNVWRWESAWQPIGNIRGPIGLPGENGSNGARGSLWSEGDGDPSAQDANPGDMYLNVANGDVWQWA